MNSEQMAGKWQQLKGFVRQQWARLTGNYGGVVAGMRQRSRGKIRAGQAVTEQAKAQRLAEWRERLVLLVAIHK